MWKPKGPQEGFWLSRQAVKTRKRRRVGGGGGGVSGNPGFRRWRMVGRVTDVAGKTTRNKPNCEGAAAPGWRFHMNEARSRNSTHLPLPPRLLYLYHTNQ